MVTLTPTEDQQLLIETINRYANNDVRPIAHEHDENSTPPLDTIKRGWQIGLVPSAIPETFGGFGEMSAMTGVLAAEELAYGDLSVAMHILTPALFAYPLVLFGTEDQQSNLLEMFLDEDVAPATAALLEPGITFDPYDLKTTASANGSTISLNGTKAYVPLVDEADCLLVYARDSETGEVNAYIVKKDSAGLSIEKREMLMGLRALPTYRIHLNNVEVQSSARLSNNWDYEVILNRMRVGLAAMSVGVARASYEYALEYAKQREQFGRPIAQNQSIAFMLAEMAVEIDATRLMVWEAAWKLDKGESCTREAYLAKQYADDMVLTITDGGVQTLGGYGFIREFPVERWLRNGRGFPTFHGLAII